MQLTQTLVKDKEPPIITCFINRIPQGNEKIYWRPQWFILYDKGYIDGNNISQMFHFLNEDVCVTKWIPFLSFALLVNLSWHSCPYRSVGRLGNINNIGSVSWEINETSSLYFMKSCLSWIYEIDFGTKTNLKLREFLLVCITRTSSW